MGSISRPGSPSGDSPQPFRCQCGQATSHTCQFGRWDSPDLPHAPVIPHVPLPRGTDSPAEPVVSPTPPSASSAPTNSPAGSYDSLQVHPSPAVPSAPTAPVLPFPPVPYMEDVTTPQSPNPSSLGLTYTAVSTEAASVPPSVPQAQPFPLPSAVAGPSSVTFFPGLPASTITPNPHPSGPTNGNSVTFLPLPPAVWPSAPAGTTAPSHNGNSEDEPADESDSANNSNEEDSSHD